MSDQTGGIVARVKRGILLEFDANTSAQQKSAYDWLFSCGSSSNHLFYHTLHLKSFQLRPGTPSIPILLMRTARSSEEAGPTS